MRYNMNDALLVWKPNSEYVITGESYDGLVWVSSDIKPTEKEITAKVTELNNAEPMRLLRVERDKRLAACDWRASSDLTLTDPWKTYRQALRDLPASASPKLDNYAELDLSSVTFPTEPT